MLLEMPPAQGAVPASNRQQSYVLNKYAPSPSAPSGHLQARAQGASHTGTVAPSWLCRHWPTWMGRPPRGWLPAHPRRCSRSVPEPSWVTAALSESLPSAQSKGEKELNVHRNGTPLQYSCLENPMDGGAW